MANMKLLRNYRSGQTFKSNKVVTGIQFEKIKTDTNEFYVSSSTTESNKVNSKTIEYGCMGYYFHSRNLQKL